MEGKQTEKKRRNPALLAVLVAAFMLLGLGKPQPASAQFPVNPTFQNPVVAPNGVGDLLIFPLWTTQEGRDTLFAITNVFGGLPPTRFVHVRLREGVASQDVLNFTVCLSPGDVWTAALTSSGEGSSILRIGNPGSCDELVPAAGFTPPPILDVDVPVPADFGYIEAYTMKLATGGDDALMGVATPLNPTSGFSSSYTATALVGFNATSESASAVNLTGSGTVGNAGSRSNVQRALAREGGVDKEILITRWTALPDIGSFTQLVFTFPGGGQPGNADPLSAFFFDEDENINFSPRLISLPREVNVCTIDRNEAGTTTFSCAGSSLPPLNVFGSAGTFTSGWLRIQNNGIGASESDELDTLPISRFPVLGLAFSFFMNVEAGDFDQSFPLQWAAVEGAGATVDASARIIGGGVTTNASQFSYNIDNPAAAPFFTPPGTSCSPASLLLLTPNLCLPGDNVSGALARTGTTQP